MKRPPLAPRVLLALAAMGLAACQFQIAGFLLPGDDGGVVLPVDGGDDLASDDGGITADLSGLCSPGGPSLACASDGITLITCVAGMQVPIACDVACSSDGQAHCTRLDPGGVAEPSDYELPGLMDVDLGGSITFNTDTGAITADALDRAGGVGVVSGVGFRVAPQINGPSVGIFSFRSLNFAGGSTVRLVGSQPASFVAAGNITVRGELDVQGSCAPGNRVAGGGLGGAPKTGDGNPGGGTGAGLAGLDTLGGAGGGGGGGYGDVGGAGAAGTADNASGGGAGPLFGDLTLPNPILVGGGGGGSGAGGAASSGGAGGAGGGAIQLAANGSVILGSNALLQAGGCRGRASTSGFGGGGGGGAGGMILVEARVVQVAAGARIVANGGSGAGGGNGNNGEDGPDDTNDARGGGGGGNNGQRGSDGGDGGHTGRLFGRPGAVISGSEVYGGGGGGGVGRIALKSKSGAVTLSGVVLSPMIDEATPGRAAPARLGMIGFR